MTDAVKAVANGLPQVARAKPAQRSAASLTQAVKAKGKHRRNPPATRTGRKGIVIYVDQQVAATIHRLASAFDTTVQELGEQAFNLLFTKYGEPQAPDRSAGRRLG